jgi:site-specific recombinase XerD
MYRFSKNITQQLQLFAERLSGYAPPTVRQYRNYAGVFLSWCEKQKYSPELLGYEQLMDFILAQKERMSDRQINRTLVAIRHYYRVFDLHPDAGTAGRLR